MKEPKCPSCEITGVEYITHKINTEQISDDEKYFNIAYCTNCGHIYNIFPITLLEFLATRKSVSREGAGPKRKE